MSLKQITKQYLQEVLGADDIIQYCVIGNEIVVCYQIIRDKKPLYVVLNTFLEHLEDEDYGTSVTSYDLEECMIEFNDWMKV